MAQHKLSIFIPECSIKRGLPGKDARFSQWRREGEGKGERPPPGGGALQGAAFEGQKFGILAFALQCLRVSLYLLCPRPHRAKALSVALA